MVKARSRAVLFFLGSLLLTPIGYLAGTSLGAFLARNVAGLTADEMASSSAAMWLVFGGAGAAISSLHLLLFLCTAPRSGAGLPNTA